MSATDSPNLAIPLQIDSCKRILIAGATGGIGKALTTMLADDARLIIGAHGRRKNKGASKATNVHSFQRELRSVEDCQQLVDDYVGIAKGIDGLVVLVGGMQKPSKVQDLSAADWSADIELNLSIPFFLAQSALRAMEAQGGGGKIILTGTESALHGGGPDSLAYGVAKAGIECVVKGLARTGASANVLVNGVRLGFIDSGFHQRWQNKSADDLKKRAGLVPLGRAGTPKEAAGLIAYLLSDWSNFMTGEMISLAGGDWL